MVAIRVFEHTAQRKGTLNEDRSRVWVRVFTVIVTSSTDGPEDAINANGIPRLWVPYVPPSGGFDLGARCRTIEATPTDSAYVWTVTCTYDSKPIQGNSPNKPEQPTQEPPEISYSTSRVSRPWQFDRTGVAVTNSAGDLFDPPQEEDEKRIGITIVKNQLTFLPAYYLNYIDSINADKWFNFPRGSVRCMDISASFKIQGIYTYWRVTFKFEAKAERLPKKRRWGNIYDIPGGRMSQAWTVWFLDRGFRERRNGRLVHINHPETGLPVSTPWMLDGEGVALPLPSNSRTDPNATPPEDDGGAGGDWGTGSGDEEDVPYTPLPSESGYTPPNNTPNDGGRSGNTVVDPVFLGYNQFPARKFIGLGIF